MCGRYVLFSDAEVQDIREIIEAVQRQNNGQIITGEIFPTNKAPVLLGSQNKVVPELLTWGFPNFRTKGVIINARSETVEEKPMFRRCLYTKRCVIPSNGFYEWSHDSEKRKYLFNVPGTQALYMAGLYNEFDGEKRFVILTADANSSISDIHNRMPVVLDKAGVNNWILDSQAANSILHEDHPFLNRKLA